MNHSKHVQVDLSRSVQEILTLGGDSRLAIAPGARHNRYGCATEPEPHVVPFGSCTASTVSSSGFAAAGRLLNRLRALDNPEQLVEAIEEHFQLLRSEILHLLVGAAVPGVEVMFSPSGTDAQLLILALAAGPVPHERISAVVVGPTELGSGSILAAGGMHFDEIAPSGRRPDTETPLDGALADAVRVREVWLRDSSGEVRPPDDLDREVESIVHGEIAQGRRVVLHVVAHSKTGIHAPTLPAVERLRAAHGDQLAVVIDAAQGRFSRRGLRRALRAGYVVLVTGSKFYGGPPFSGSVLLPPGSFPEGRCLTSLPSAFGDYFSSAFLPREWTNLRATLPEIADLGLLFRWTAATAEMRDYYETPAALRLKVLRAFEQRAGQAINATPTLTLETPVNPVLDDAADRFLQSKATVFPFFVTGRDGRRYSASQLRDMHRWMNRDLSTALASTDSTTARTLAGRFLLGQPVDLGRDGSGPAVLRISLGGVLLGSVASDPAYGLRFEDRLAWLDRQLHAACRKLDVLAREFDAVQAAETSQTVR